MAEVVEWKIEGTITELEQLSRYGLVDDQEVKAIIKKRKAFEYRLQRNTRCKEDFLKYIAYEESLLRLIRLRRDKIGFHSKTNQIEHTICQHIQSLYKQIVFKNQFDVQMWLSFIDFCQRHRLLAKVSSLYSRVLSVHNDKDWLWIRAAKFEAEDNNSPETARSLLQRGIRFNAESRLLWHQYFKLELMFCTKIRNRRQILMQKSASDEHNEEEDVKKEVNDVNDEVLNGKIACIVYQNAVLALTDLKFAADFLPICSQFDHKLTQRHKDLIYEDLKTRFNSSEQTWDLMAKRIVDEGKQWTKNSDNLSKSEKKLRKKEFERQAISLYEQKVVEFNNEEMWSLYINYRLEQLSKYLKESKIRQTLAKTLDLIERAWSQNCLSIELFKEWIKLYFSCEDKYDNKMKIKQILLNGCERWSDGLDVWHFSIPFAVKIIDSKQEMKNFFEKVLHKFSENERSDESIAKLIEIWEQYMKWSTKSLQPIEVMNITKKLSKLSADKTSKRINEHMRPFILEALNTAYGLEKTRHYYHLYKKFPPNVLSFHKKMIEIEAKNANINYHLIHSIHEHIIYHFGSNDASLWIDYVMFEIQHNAQKVADIYYKAIKCLTPEECDKFIEKYTILKANDFQCD